MLLLLGCSKERTINGEIFIVTQGGENYKLGLVQVRLIDPKSMSTHLYARTIEATDSLLPVYARYLHLRGIADSLQTILDDLERRRNALSDRDQNELIDQKLALLTRELSLSKKRLAILYEISPLEAQVIRFTGGAHFFGLLPPSVDSTKTDADGRFSFKVIDRDTLMIVAAATRRVGSTTEEYFWSVPYPNPNFRPEDKLLLSNDNLFNPSQQLNLPTLGTHE